HPAQIAAVSFSVLQQGNQIGNANHRQGAAYFVAVESGDSVCHVSAIAAAGNHDLAGIEFGALPDPVKQSADVFVRIVAMETIIESQESFEIGRASCRERV